MSPKDGSGRNPGKRPPKGRRPAGPGRGLGGDRPGWPGRGGDGSGGPKRAGRPPTHRSTEWVGGRERSAGDDTPPRGPRKQIVYGRNAVREALRGRRRVHRIWATATAAREDWGAVKVTIADADELELRAGSDGHQGVCAEADPYPYADADDLLGVEDGILVVLDEVTDPQNLGAICRTAECAGAAGVIIPERRSAEVTGAACKASAGAVEHLPVAQVRNVADFLADAKAAGWWTYGAAAEGATAYDRPDYDGRVILVLGAEGRGLRPRVAKSCDVLVSLPLLGRIESLNVSAAAGALLYGILQRRTAP